MTLKQVHMHIMDIIPTESFWPIVDDTSTKEPETRVWLREELIDDIRQHGIKYALNVDEEGHIKNGNMRYWCARWLLEHENDQRFLYLPVSRAYAAGCFHTELVIRMKQDVDTSPEALDRYMDKITSQIARYWINDLKEAVIPSATTFTDYPVCEDDPYTLQTNWPQCTNNWSIVAQPKPNDNQTTIIVGIPGPSMPPNDQQAAAAHERRRTRVAKMAALQAKYGISEEA
jgi:hypothetical protein